MKKVLLGTSAIALAGAFAAPADAAEWTVRVGGYMEQFTGYASTDVGGGWDVEAQGLDSDFNSVIGVTDPDDLGDVTNSDTVSFFNPSALSGDYDGVDVKSDTEIHFMPSITLDNGMQFGAVVELEGNSTGDQIDESYMRIKGSFGEINLGSENSAGYKMTYAAPNVTFVGTNSGSLTAFFPIGADGAGDDLFRAPLGASFVEVAANNDANRLTYYTPRFAGLQVGVSYARDANQDSNTQVDTDGELHDIFDIGANYVNSFGAFNVAVSGRYGIGDSAGGGGDPEVWAAGLNLGYGGFTLGGSYADADGDHGAGEGHYWDAGVSYETGPWGFSFTHARGQSFDNDCSSLAAADDDFEAANDSLDPTNWSCIGSMDEELHQYMIGINYTMAQGVNLGVFGAYVDFEGATAEFSDTPNGGGGNGGFSDGDTETTEFDGWVIGTGVKISF